jgi:hypothetical protein
MKPSRFRVYLFKKNKNLSKNICEESKLWYDDKFDSGKSEASGDREERKEEQKGETEKERKTTRVSKGERRKKGKVGESKKSNRLGMKKRRKERKLPFCDKPGEGEWYIERWI